MTEAPSVSRLIGRRKAKRTRYRTTSKQGHPVLIMSTPNMHEIIQTAFTLTGVAYVTAVLVICCYGALTEGEPIIALEMIAIWAVGPLAFNLLAAYIWVSVL